jgi:hypothetical protein
VLQALDHVVVVVAVVVVDETNEVDFGENVVVESVVIANYRFEMEVMMDELLMEEGGFIPTRNLYGYLVLVLMVFLVEQDSNLKIFE